jgi:hypothetical protein
MSIPWALHNCAMRAGKTGPSHGAIWSPCVPHGLSSTFLSFCSIFRFFFFFHLVFIFVTAWIFSLILLDLKMDKVEGVSLTHEARIWPGPGRS